MVRTSSRLYALIVTLFGLTACGDDGAKEADAGSDTRALDVITEAAPQPDGPVGEFCREDLDCAPAEGAALCAITFCDRAFLRCTTTGPDLDADGHADRNCDPGVGATARRGDDCDDSDPARFPGRPEVCDALGHDEDCNSVTVAGAEGDVDGDGSFTMMCCNRDDATGEVLCGADCNDADSTVNPSAGDGSDAACDGVDNDCDLEIDEGCACRDAQTRRCGTDIGECLPGTEVCSSGAWGPCQGAVDPTPEDCDGDDDDCNMVVDDGCGCVDGTARACGLEEGVCRAGVQRCEGGVWSSVCEGAVGPTPEACDGDDDDCNGMLDDGCECLDGASRACPDGTNVGECVTGTQTCSAGAWASCVGGVAPVLEVCDGTLDQNCNGRSDAEDGCECSPGMTASCGGGPVNTPPARCQLGVRMCVDGHLGACEGSVDPAPEVCNAIDDDCDGAVNEEPEAGSSCAAAGATTACVSGACVIVTCAPGLGNCDMDPRTGCEVDTRTSTTHCGTCNSACDPGQSCLGGVCDPVTSIAAAFGHTCVSRASGHVYCWGLNQYGQLGNGMSGDGMSSSLPIRVTGITDAIQVVAGSGFTCALRAGGSVACWGDNGFGQIGAGSTGGVVTAPTAVAGLSDATTLAAGSSHACARRSSTGTVVCWGSNLYGQIGNGTSGPGMAVPSPVSVTGLSSVSSIGLGSSHSCATTTAGVARCWGLNASGQIGDGTTTSPRSSATAVSTLADSTVIDGGSGHSCALVITAAGARCWGANSRGQLGTGTTMASPTAVSVVGGTGWVELSSAENFNCARTGAGTVVCWGDGEFGQLGEGRSGVGVHSTIPMPVVGLSDAVEIEIGNYHACARRADGTVVCWGDGLYGQLGDGRSGAGVLSTTPAPVVGIP